MAPRYFLCSCAPLVSVDVQLLQIQFMVIINSTDDEVFFLWNRLSAGKNKLVFSVR
jgi:hypothetical protein